MNRRGFFRVTGGALLVLPLGSLLVQACYGSTASDGETPAAPPTISGSNAVYTSSIDGDHSHTFAIALAALSTPVASHGPTSVDEGHSHEVEVSADDLQQVANGQTVTVTTATSEGHTHVLTLVKVG